METIIGSVIGGLATIAAAIIGIRWQRKHATDENHHRLSNEISSEKTCKNSDPSSVFARRYFDYPSHYRFVNYLPKLKAVVLESARDGWDTGVTADMREASYDVIDFLEYAWLRLARFYPKNHWGGQDAETYIANYIRDRFAFHWSKYEPDGPGTGGTIVGVLVSGDVIKDMERLIEETVSALFMHQDNFDFMIWKQEWNHEKSDRQQQDERHALSTAEKF
jgi:hypothetical protein